MTRDSLLATPVGNYALDEAVRRDLTVAAIGRISEAALYDCIAAGAAEASSEKWRVPPVRIFPWDAVITAAEAEALVGAITRCAAARWWSSAVLDRAQLWVGARDAIPEPKRPSPRHYGKPPNEIWTSSALDDGTSTWWLLYRNGADSPPPTEPQSLWRLTPSPDARVYEINSATDWAGLCDGFPIVMVDGYVGPDWDAVASEYDGIHLSVEGLIRAQGVPVETSGGTAMLDNWDVESTAWLRWCFDSVERMGELDPDPVRRGISALRARRRS